MADGRTDDSLLPPLVIIAGPTASGKSALAVELATQLNGEIINCDAMQVYRGFQIGTAKISEAERQGIPHHLLDCCDPDQTFSAGEFSRRARRIIPEITGRGRLPIVAGGTGFYIQVLIEGLFQGPLRNDALRLRLLQREGKRPGILHRLLRRLDPHAGQRIHANDIQKTVRAIEVCFEGQRLSDLHQERAPERLEGYRVIRIFLDPPRPEVHARINQRCIEMFRNGLLEEVEGLIAEGVSPKAQPFLAVGYREALAALRSEITVDRAIELTQIATRQYAKRQWTWFRRDHLLHSLPGFGTEAHIIAQAQELLD